MANHPNRGFSAKAKRPVQWIDICRVYRLMGEAFEDETMQESFRLWSKLQDRVKAGKVRRTKWGHYQLVRDAK